MANGPVAPSFTCAKVGMTKNGGQYPRNIRNIKMQYKVNGGSANALMSRKERVTSGGSKRFNRGIIMKQPIRNKMSVRNPRIRVVHWKPNSGRSL